MISTKSSSEISLPYESVSDERFRWIRVHGLLMSLASEILGLLDQRRHRRPVAAGTDVTGMQGLALVRPPAARETLLWGGGRGARGPLCRATASRPGKPGPGPSWCPPGPRTRTWGRVGCRAASPVAPQRSRRRRRRHTGAARAQDPAANHRRAPPVSPRPSTAGPDGAGLPRVRRPRRLAPRRGARHTKRRRRSPRQVRYRPARARASPQAPLPTGPPAPWPRPVPSMGRRSGSAHAPTARRARGTCSRPGTEQPRKDSCERAARRQSAPDATPPAHAGKSARSARGASYASSSTWSSSQRIESRWEPAW
jgi:hypothetical protein